MQAIPISKEDFIQDYPEASALLLSAVDLDDLDIFYHEDMLFAYPKAECIFKLGSWSAFYNKYNRQWQKALD